MEEQTKLSQLQALVDEVSATFGGKNWKAAMVPSCTDGEPLQIEANTASFSESQLDLTDPSRLRFELAVNMGRQIAANRVLPYKWAKYLPLVALLIFADRERTTTDEAFAFWYYYFPFVVAMLVALGVTLGVESWAKNCTKTEPFLRKLLELTRDVGRTRDYLVAQKGTPEELAKFDALVRELGLNQTQPARG